VHKLTKMPKMPF